MNETILLMTIIHLLFALTMILIRFNGYLFISSSFIQYLNLVCPLVLIDMKLNHVTYLGGVIQTACIFFRVSYKRIGKRIDDLQMINHDKYAIYTFGC